MKKYLRLNVLNMNILHDLNVHSILIRSKNSDLHSVFCMNVHMRVNLDGS